MNYPITPELTGTLWSSEKRTKLLLLLSDNTQDIEHIKKSLNVSSRDIMPLIKKMRKDQLAIEEKHGFSLTPIAELLVDNMKLFLDTTRVIDENRDFWETRDFKGIPEDLFDRIGELGHYYLIEPDLHNIYDFPKEFRENVLKCKNIMMLNSYLHPAYPQLCQKILDKGSNYSLYLLPPLLEKIENEPELAERLFSAPNLSIYLIKEKIYMPMLCVTEKFVYFSIFNTDGHYEHRDILSFDESAVKWGEELIAYYSKLSTAIKVAGVY